MREPEQARVEQGRLPRPLAPHKPVGEQRKGDRSDRDQQSDELAAFLPDENAEHEAAHAEHREDRADQVDLPRPRVGHVTDELDLRQHDRDHDDLEPEADTPREVRRHKATQQRPNRCRDRGSGPDQRIRPRASRALEVPVDQGLHCGQQQRRPEPADDRPEDNDRGQALSQRHRQGSDRVGTEPEHIGPLAPEQIADLAADQDERSGHQRLERDRGLNVAHGRVQILDHGRDRDVHQRGVDDEHEHRHGEQEREPRVGRSSFRSARRHALTHKRSTGDPFGIRSSTSFEASRPCLPGPRR